MQGRVQINGVECELVGSRFQNKGGRLLVPHLVEGKSFLEFAVTLFAKSSSNPEKEKFLATFVILAYYTHCYKYLLNQR